MALDVYVREDIERGIKSTLILALSVFYANGGRNTEHVCGILAHAHAQAELYGINWLSLVADCRLSLGADIGGLLEAALKSAALEG
jgi:hypothetical protein